MKKLMLTALSLFSLTLLFGCATSNKTSKTSSPSTQTSIKNEEMKSYTLHDSTFKIPASWNSKDGNTADTKYFYPKDGLLTVSFQSIDASIFDANTRSEYLSGIKKDFKNFSTTDGGKTGDDSYGWNTSFDINGKTYDGELIIVNVDGGFLTFLMGTTNKTFENYRDSFNKVMRSVSYPQRSNDQTSESSSTKNSSDADLEAWLQKYKAFTDSYSDFVDQYNADPTNPDLLNKLSEMTTQETQWVAECSKYNGQLTGDDLAEYTAISSKLLQAYERLGK